MRPDELSVEFFKLGLTHDLTVLWEFHRVMTLCHQRKVQQRWRDAVINVLSKKKDRTEWKNYRNWRVPYAGKVLLKVVATRLRDYCEAKDGCRRSSAGSARTVRRGYMMFAIRGLHELERKAHVLLFLLCFTDLLKAYDSLCRPHHSLAVNCSLRSTTPQMIEVIH